MTNHNKKLDEMLSDFRQSSLIINASNSLGAGEKGREAFAQSLDEAKQAILDWHNKQTTKELDAIMEWHEKEVEALLDRIEPMAAYDPSGSPPVINPRQIEVERNRLKERDDDQL